MTDERKKVTGHILACGTQIMWGATFVSTKVLLNYFLPAEVLFTRAVLTFLALLVFYPHHLKLKNAKQELAFAGAGLFGIVFLIPVLIQQKASFDLNAMQKPEVIVNFLFLGIGASATGFFLWNLATKWIGALKTSVYIYVSPVVTVVLSVFVLHEKMTAASVIGSLLIFAGLVISQKKSGKSSVAEAI